MKGVITEMIKNCILVGTMSGINTINNYDNVVKNNKLEGNCNWITL